MRVARSSQAKRLSLGCAALAAAVIAGCGGDGSGEELSASRFESQADEICRQSQQQFNRIQGTGTSTADQAERQVEALIEVAEQALDELRGLEPPEGRREEYDDYLASRKRAIELLEEGRDGAADRDFAAYLDVKRRVAADTGARIRLARAAGLDDCARPTAGGGGDG